MGADLESESELMSEFYIPKNPLSASTVIKLIGRSLYNLNKDLQLHNERTAYITLEIAKRAQLSGVISTQSLFFLAMYHTIGFFRFNIDSKGENLFSKETENNYLYGYFYLKYMTPLQENAKALTYADVDFNPILSASMPQFEYGNLIFMASRIAQYLEKNDFAPLPADLNEIAPGKFNPDFVEAFNLANENNRIFQALKEETFLDELLKFINDIHMDYDDVFSMLKFMIYIMDFKSTFTVNHIINTTCYACALGSRMNQDENVINTLFAGSILHDIGKLAVPTEILEAPGKLTDEQMTKMKSHVVYSRKIIQGIVPSEVCEAACRHHEKLNGKGYPQGLTSDDLTLTERILSVADITSALSDNRSYKGEFPPERIIQIISEMASNNELDEEVTKFIAKYYSDIKAELPFRREQLMANYASIMADYNLATMIDESMLDNMIDESMADLGLDLDLDLALNELDEVEDLDGELEDLEEL